MGGSGAMLRNLGAMPNIQASYLLEIGYDTKDLSSRLGRGTHELPNLEI